MAADLPSGREDRAAVIEAWLTGPVDGVHPLLMPAAHSFVQVQHELPLLLQGLSLEQIWETRGASASIGFHAVHLAGATDRLLTYARGEQLSGAQLESAKAEKQITGLSAEDVIRQVNTAMERALAQLRHTPPDVIAAARAVGRQQLPSTVLGLLFHAAEHATRHAGQIATLRKIVQAS
jgi:uncharacterized damage-inducible protein DinB